MMNGIVAQNSGAIFDNFLVVYLPVMAALLGAAFACRVAAFGPPVVFAMAWGKLSQQIPKGIPNLTGEFKPSFEGKSEPVMRKPTCLYRFNGIHLTRHFTGGFYFLEPTCPFRLFFRTLSA